MDLSKIKDLKDLQSLLDLMGRYELVELELEGDGQRVRLRKADPGAHREIVGYPLSAVGSSTQAAASAAAQVQGTGSAAAEPGRLKELLSPMVGTFYRAPSPEAEPYVREGDHVSSDTTLCIIEAMKVMNEIPAGASGIVREILVKNGESVEFGQPLFRIEVE